MVAWIESVSASLSDLMLMFSMTSLEIAEGLVIVLLLSEDDYEDDDDDTLSTTGTLALMGFPTENQMIITPVTRF